MATRPFFIPDSESNRLVQEVAVDFDWSPGFAVTQKRKNIAAMHEAAAALGYSPLLEISTKSECRLGQRMSAFNLSLKLHDGTEISLESAFQGSKVFENGGPYTDVYRLGSRDAKKDQRLRSSGNIIGFCFDGLEFPSEPKTAFYDWLYIGALAPHEEYLQRLESFEGFTDIEFNPKRSLNCQARSCALYVSLSRRGLLQELAHDPEKFVEALTTKFGQFYFDDDRQGRLF